MLRDAAVNWFAANCPSHDARRDLVRGLDETISAGTNCSFSIGAAMTKQHKPFLLHWLAGEFFVFELSSGQAKRLRLPPSTIRHIRGGRSRLAAGASAGVISLEALELDQPVLKAVDQPIPVRARYRILGQVPDQLALRMDFTLAGKAEVISYAYPGVPMQPDGMLQTQFKLTPTTQLAPVLAVFVRCCTIPQAGVSDGMPLSNAVAAILEIGSEGEGRLPDDQPAIASDRGLHSGGFTGSFAYVSPNGSWQKVPGPHPLSWDSSDMRTAFQLDLETDGTGFRQGISLNPHAPVDLEWVGTGTRQGIAFWRRNGAIQAASVMLGGRENEQARAALREVIRGRNLPLPDGAWQIIQQEPKRPLFVTFHFDIRSVGDPVVGAVAPVLASALFASGSRELP